MIGSSAAKWAAELSPGVALVGGGEEGLGVGEIPTTLRVRVEGLMEERRERARKALGHFVRIRIHFNTVVRDASEAVLVIVGELVQLPELA